jgi:class 3 adenylate cyclase
MAIGTVSVNPDSTGGKTIELTDGDVLGIGRRENPETSHNLLLPFAEVSSRHAEIRCQPDGWILVDLGSTNGTLVNGWNLHAGHLYLLRPGDRITIAGNFDLRVQPPVDPGSMDGKTQDLSLFKIQLINATILVGDIKGFTSIMEQHATEPELVMKAARKIFNDLAKEVRKNQGQLEKIAGDAIMAYWKPVDPKVSTYASVYQAVLACTTAIEMSAMTAILAKNANYWPFPKNPFKLDIAIATGPVASGAFGHGNESPQLLGDTANLVFKLEKLIGDDGSGDIVVEAATYELAKEHFKFESLGEFKIKGRKQPINVYRLLSKNPVIVE